MSALLVRNPCENDYPEAAYPLTRQRPRSRWSVRERRTTNFAVVEFYGSDWLALIDNTGTKSSGLRIDNALFASKVLFI